jgi:hypothetical protein
MPSSFTTSPFSLLTLLTNMILVLVMESWPWHPTLTCLSPAASKPHVQNVPITFVTETGVPLWSLGDGVLDKGYISNPFVLKRR